jgi:acetylornithine/succinyldiaminopimelate/putrescine aminotransferase
MELFTFLRDMQKDPELCIVDVRGRGLMVAVEFACDDGRQPTFKPTRPKQSFLRVGSHQKYPNCARKGAFSCSRLRSLK